MLSLNIKSITIALAVTLAVLIGAMIPTASERFFTYMYTLKYTCQGPCQVELGQDDHARKYIDFDAMQERNSLRAHSRGRSY